MVSSSPPCIAAAALWVLASGLLCTSAQSAPRPQRLESPVDAAIELLKAVKANDTARVNACLTLSGDDLSREEKEVVTAFIADSLIVPRMFREVILRKFGMALDFQSEPISDERIEATIKALYSGVTKTSGDTATISVPRRPNVTMVETPLRRVAGEWKIEANVLLGIRNPGLLFKKDSSLRSWFRISTSEYAAAREIIAGVECGNIRTAEEVTRLFLEKRQLASQLSNQE